MLCWAKRFIKNLFCLNPFWSIATKQGRSWTRAGLPSALAILGLIGYSNVKAESALVTVGNVLQVAMPLGAAGISVVKDDDAGLWQLVKSEVVTAGITYGLKYTVNSTAPNGEQHSFPSGHASITFSAAQFLQTRYGWEYGVPAYALASVTAYSRVSGDQHYWGDVLAGAAIGMASSYWFTTPFKDAQMSVIATPTFLGMQYRGRW